MGTPCDKIGVKLVIKLFIKRVLISFCNDIDNLLSEFKTLPFFVKDNKHIVKVWGWANPHAVIEYESDFLKVSLVFARLIPYNSVRTFFYWAIN